MRPCQSAVMLPVMPPSRASSLPQVLSTSAKGRLAGRPPRGLMLIVPTLRVGMHPVTLRVTIAQDSNLASTAGRRASPAAFPRGAWERSGRVSVEEPGRPAGRLALLCFGGTRPLERPSAGSAQWAPRQGCRGSRPRPWMADGGGPTEQDRSEGMPSLSEAPNVRGKSAWLLGASPSDPPSGRNQ
jgi:hypothetical protein